MGDMLRFLDLTSWVASGDTVSAALFQTNVVQSSNTGRPWFSDSADTALGTPTEAVQSALAHFDIATIRFPGGETDLVFSAGLLPDGALAPNIVNMLDFAQTHGLSVDMVLPVDTPDGFSRAEFLSQVRDFAIAVEARFPGVVGGYELGNEYWGGRLARDASLEFDYGHKAGQVAAALSSGFETAGTDADIYLQAAGNLRGAFGNNPDAANARIQRGVDQTEGARDAIDGIIRNSYWRDPETDGFENDSGLFAEDRGLEQTLHGTAHAWETWAGRDLIQRVGEYNINRNIALGDDRVDIGIHGASYLLEHVENMIDAGVDQAFAWPLSHNTQNAYLFRDEDIATTQVHGLDIATNTTRAAMLDLLRQTLPGHELVTGSWTMSPAAGGADNDVEVTLFENTGGDHLVFLSSRSDQPMTIRADLSDFVTEFDTLRAISIRPAETGGNLRDAIVTEVAPITHGDSAIVELDLQPYEVVQLRFDRLPDAEPALATAAPGLLATALPAEPSAQDDLPGNRLRGSDTDDRLAGTSGDDALFGRDGDDGLSGHAGDDLLRGGSGKDTLFGGQGADTLQGDLGHDRLDAGRGADWLDGGHGRDTLIGGAGNDTLIGGEGHDVFVHSHPGRGFDVILDFEIGTDSLVFDHPAFTGPDALRLVPYLSDDVPSTLIRFTGADGAVDRSLGGIVLHGVENPTVDQLNPVFPAEPLQPEPAPDMTLPMAEPAPASLLSLPAPAPQPAAEDDGFLHKILSLFSIDPAQLMPDDEAEDILALAFA